MSASADSLKRYLNVSDGRREERAAVTNWLRRHGYEQIARKVEAGEHWRD
jgi:hypothetical protein